LIEEKLIAWKRWKYSQLTEDNYDTKKLLFDVKQQQAVNFKLLKKLHESEAIILAVFTTLFFC